ncbi:MAG TPA: plastocyanin/azurin family copper-binding protein [Candidatus Acidoferrum sp.]|nr:plastocyanin/azurin family copper-binding protein [Candidatus Acidoferrum sp.]
MRTARHRLYPAAALAALLAGCNTSGPAYDLPPGIYDQIVDMTTTLSFSPQTVSIKAGQVVLWRNQSLFAHTVTFDRSAADDPNDVVVPVGAEPFSSGDIPPGETFAHKFTVPGTYRYVCLKHEGQSMTGTIIVTQ